jgi:hypothetical protein
VDGLKIMERVGKKKKGGAEKIRDKRQKSLQAEASGCFKIDRLFAVASASTVAASAPDVPAATTGENATSTDETEDFTGEVSPGSKPIDDDVYVGSELEDSLSSEQGLGNEAHEMSEEPELHRSSASTVNVPSATSEAEPAMHYFTRPTQNELPLFFEKHPTPNTKKILNKWLCCRNGTERSWLTYNDITRTAFCSLCLAFSSEGNPFTKGMGDWRHIKQRIEEHERSVQHREVADGYLLWTSRRDIASLLCQQQVSARHEQVKQRRQVMERLVEIVKVIGKRGLSFRGGGISEAAYSLDDATMDHGTFLELVMLLSKFDPCLQKHVHECIESSKKLHGSGSTVRGRGSLVTFLSKTTVNSMIGVIGRLIQDKVAAEVRQAEMFSIQIDTTQDISSHDQCSVVIRYVTDSIHERLIGVINFKASTGQYFVDLIQNLLGQMGIDLKLCAGNATDGAANMQGEYRGFSTLLSSHAPGQVHVWCYAHILNLVLADTTGVVIESASLFSLLNDIAVFLRESHQRMAVFYTVL